MNLIRNYRDWRRYSEAVSELSRLSTHELNDLSSRRGEIPHVARRALLSRRSAQGLPPP